MATPLTLQGQTVSLPGATSSNLLGTTPTSTTPTSTTPTSTSPKSTGGSAGAAAVGDTALALNATKQAANATGLSNVGTAAGDALLGLGIYSGITKGGVAGDTSAAVDAASLANKGLAATGAISGATSAGLSSALGAAGIGLNLYNEVTQWQSGATGADALAGLQTGASIGTMILPGIGTLIGGALGAIGGAVSSAFGGGKNDPETLNAYSANQAGTNTMAGANVGSSFNYLTGVMDAKDPTAGHSTQLEQVFGKQGESNVLNGMASTIDSAIQSGTIAQAPGGGITFKTGGGTVTYKGQDAANQVFSQVVLPWLNQKGVSSDSLTFTDARGNSSGNNLQASLTNLVGAYLGGSLTSKTALDSSGQTDSSLAALV